MFSEEGIRASEQVGLVTNVQRFSLHDGGGIRTVVFLKGCPFRCPWCCNPENLSFEPEVSFTESLCIECSPRPGGRTCDVPPERCPTGAKKVVGQARDVDGLVAEAIRDRAFFEQSGGGVTLSGGEALAHEAFATAFLAGCKGAGVRTALETTLALPLEDAEALVRATDAFLVDFKIANRERSLAVTGIDTSRRDENLARILARGATVVARVPVIPGYTDDADNAETNARTMVDLGIARVDVLPFHQLGEAKYGTIGRSYAMAGVRQLAGSDVNRIVATYAEAGLDVVVSGE